ncbi:Serine/threonine-protein phosphatase 2A activator [Spiromyces aspiralis]|uniref:Serine/threonine-protein phosphatase 2A activator n=1 Tax=Spiromyces aspiralis TaxID=68401 RepID=A0ACC1H8P8_9FUNG|nr:Serine/threonine-protein phosphatase 2A activator [Spiromyces aspiralis]
MPCASRARGPAVLYIATIGSSTVPAISIDPKTVDCEHREYLYLGGIKFIFEMKKGPFFEHSRQLYDISGVQTWEKVNKGLSKMYDVEVLSKSPVVQHLVFGSLFSFEPSL